VIELKEKSPGTNWAISIGVGFVAGLVITAGYYYYKNSFHNNYNRI
jgi:hypothetical protein